MDFLTILVFLFWLASQIIGNPLMLGMMSYEKFGGDPLKRNLIDMVSKHLLYLYALPNFTYFFQLVSKNLLITMAANVIVYWIPVWGRMVSPMPIWFYYITLAGIRLHALFCLSAALEGIIFRLLIELIWKRAPQICEDFFDRFLFQFNFLSSTLVVVASFWHDYNQINTGLCLEFLGFPMPLDAPGLLLGQKDDHQNHERIYNFYKRLVIYAIFVAVLICLIKMLQELFGWIFEKCSRPRRSPVQSLRTIQINNNAKNEEFMNYKIQVIFTAFLVSISYGGPKILAKSLVDRELKSVEKALIFGWDWFIFTVLVPVIWVAKKKKLRLYLYSQISSNFEKY